MLKIDHIDGAAPLNCISPWRGGGGGLMGICHLSLPHVLVESLNTVNYVSTIH